jgi:predicted enzyme related to lactoylglutathione lyase
MERVLGIGGVFFKARDPKKLAAWYRETLGVPVEMGETYAALFSREGGEPTVWSAFATDTDYFGPDDQQAMINYRVEDLDAMLAQLRNAGVAVVERIEDSEFGRFGWATDPEGNRFELWQPKAGATTAS